MIAIAFQVVGQDMAVTMACEAGQLQLNVMEPVIAYGILTSLRLLSRGYKTLRERCVVGITANPENCMMHVNNSIGIVTALLPFIGYQNASAAAKKALAEGKVSCKALCFCCASTLEFCLRQCLSVPSVCLSLQGRRGGCRRARLLDGGPGQGADAAGDHDNAAGGPARRG
eukprot:SAG22_NODE_1_length_62449_cov_158.689270_44_plen_171_part_00